MGYNVDIQVLFVFARICPHLSNIHADFITMALDMRRE